MAAVTAYRIESSHPTPQVLLLGSLEEGTMTHRRIAVLTLAAPLTAFAVVNAARHPAQAQDSQDQNTTQYESKPGMPSTGIMSPSVMRSGKEMTGEDAMKSWTMAQQEAICKTIDKLIESMTAIENEKDPVALKSKLAEHRALLGEMRDKVLQQTILPEMGKVSRIPLRPRVWK